MRKLALFILLTLTAQAQTVQLPSPEAEFIAGPVVKAGTPLADWYEQTRLTKGVTHGEAFPLVPPPFDPADGTAVDGYLNQNYYDQGLVQYQNYYLTGDPRYLAYARKIEDSWWKFFQVDEGRREPSESFAPRNSGLAGMMLSALDGHPERWPWITKYTREQFFVWVERPLSWYKPMTDAQIRGDAPEPNGQTFKHGFYEGVRDPGYMLLHAANLAKVHPDPAVREEFRAKVLDAAVNYYARLQRLQSDDGGFYFGLTDFGVTGLTTQPFQEGILGEGLIAVHRLTGDAAVGASILKLADHLYLRAYNPKGWRAFYYFVGGKLGAADCVPGCGAASNPFPPSDLSLVAEARQLNATAVHVFGYAYQLTGDAKYKTWGDEIFDSTYTGSDGYRGLAWATNHGAKEYDEAMRSGSKYLAWRLRGVVLTPSPTPTATPGPSPTPTPTPSPLPSEPAVEGQVLAWPSKTADRQTLWLKMTVEGWSCGLVYDSRLYCSRVKR